MAGVGLRRRILAKTERQKCLVSNQQGTICDADSWKIASADDFLFFFLGKQCYEKMHIVNTERTAVLASPGRGLHLVIMAAG